MTFIETNQEAIESEMKQETLAIQLYITTMQSEKFIDEIEKVCKKFSVEKDYYFKFK